MNKIWKSFSTYIIPVIIIGSVVVLCVLFLLDNLPYDDSALDVSMTQEKVVVNNELLMSDTLGKSISIDSNKNGTTGYVDIDIKSNADGKVKYEVVLVKEDATPEIDSKYVKVYVTNFNDEPFTEYNVSNIPTYYDLKVADTDPGAKVIYSGSLKNKGTAKIRVRMWVADTHEITAETMIFSTKLKVNVK